MMCPGSGAAGGALAERSGAERGGLSRAGWRPQSSRRWRWPWRRRRVFPPRLAGPRAAAAGRESRGLAPLFSHEVWSFETGFGAACGDTRRRPGAVVSPLPAGAAGSPRLASGNPCPPGWRGGKPCITGLNNALLNGFCRGEAAWRVAGARVRGVVNKRLYSLAKLLALSPEVPSPRFRWCFCWRLPLFAFFGIGSCAAPASLSSPSGTDKDIENPDCRRGLEFLSSSLLKNRV